MTTHDYSADGRTETEPDAVAEFTEWMRHEQEIPNRRATLDPVVRRRRRRGWIITAVVLALVLAAGGGYTGWGLTAPVGNPVARSETPSAAAGPPAALALPSEGASAISVAGADAYLGPEASDLWATSGTDDPRPIASISKLITALVILDAKPLAGPDDPGPTITFDKAAHDLYDRYYVRGATIAAMPTGSSMSEHDALATMLIPSASNYAEAVSTWAFGSQAGFVGAAARWLAEHGLTRTRIVEPTGISPRNTSTPSDLIALGKIAAADPVIAHLTATPSIHVPGPGYLLNTNNLLGRDGITGLKTGNLGEGSYNLLYTASFTVGEQPLSVTGVVLGGFSRDSANASVLNLLDSIRNGFHRVPLATAGDVVGSYTTPWGETAQMVIASSASIFTWSDTPISVTMDTSAPETYADGAEVGTISWTADPHTETAALKIDGDIEPPTAWWRLTHPSELG
jgi:D-alanyl-D-alanine carboxypeptidase (penicillin-binding protein 5/6)